MQCEQTLGRDGHRFPCLLGLSTSVQAGIASPYFQRIYEGEAPGRDIRIISTIMDFLVAEILIIGGLPNIAVGLYDSSTHAFNSTQVLPMTAADIATNSLNATIAAAIATYAAANSITVGAIEWGVSSTGVSFATSYPTRAVNTAYQVTGNTLVVSSIEIDATLSLTSGAKGTVTLKYADDSGITTNVKTASVGVNGNTGTLTIGLNTVGAGGGNVMGFVPAGKYYKFVTTNTTGTPTYTVLSTQETAIS